MIPVFFDRFSREHEHKDADLLRALARAGADPVVVTHPKRDLEGGWEPCRIRTASRLEVERPGFWRSLGATAALAYTWLGRGYSPVLKAMRDAGLRTVVKADSDGRIGPPVEPHWFREPLFSASGLRTGVARVAWSIRPGALARWRLDHLELADAVALESEPALQNVARFVRAWDAPHLTRRLHRVPTVVADAFLEASIGPKEPLVVAIGRWNDPRQKNTGEVVAALVRFLAQRPDYRACLVGPGLDSGVAAADRPARLETPGLIPRAGLPALLGRARTLLLGSRFEGYPLSLGEAQCLGCSVAGTPLECVYEALAGGRMGTSSDGFGRASLAEALTSEADEWAAGHRSPDRIAQLARERHDPVAVAKGFLRLLEG